jgi:heme-degrading monooxygenase HmoA
MFVRITWSKLPKEQQQVDPAASMFREKILPSLKAQPGFLGAVILANRETGDGASVTYWDTADAMRASEEVSAAGRAVATQERGIEVQDIDRFELILQDRAGPVQAGTFVRVNDVRAGTGQIDATLAFMRDSTLPAMKSLSGYRALLILANRESGRVLVSSVWDTAAQRDASEAVVSGLRRDAVAVAQAQPGDVKVTLYESVLAEVSQAAQESATARVGTA